MNLTELFQVLWRRKFVVLATFLSVMALAAVALGAQSKAYEATSTLNLTPVATDSDNDGLFLLGQMNVIAPIYAEGTTTAATFGRAAQLLGSSELGKVSVRTFRDSTILKIRVRHPDPAGARASAQAVTNALLERVGRGEIGLRQLRLSQIDRPRLPESPVSPRPGVTFAVAALLGLGFGVAAAIIRDSLGRKVDTALDLSNVVGVPCFSEIPTVRELARADSAGDLQAVIFGRKHAVLAEAFRDLHTNLQFAEGDIRSILVSSPDGRHGKTTIAIGLATTIARSGARTLLVDGDSRRGRIAGYFGRTPSPGLFDVLGGVDLDQAVASSGLDNLDVLPAGHRDEDADEILDKFFIPLLRRLEDHYDAVVIDGPPVVPVNDARIMARHTDCTLLVASAGASTRRQLRTAVERLALISALPRAVILNHSRARPSFSSRSYLDAPLGAMGRSGGPTAGLRVDAPSSRIDIPPADVDVRRHPATTPVPAPAHDAQSARDQSASEATLKRRYRHPPARSTVLPTDVGGTSYDIPERDRRSPGDPA